MNALNLPILGAAIVIGACSRESAPRTATTDTAIASATPATPAGTASPAAAASSRPGSSNVGLSYRSLPAGYRYIGGTVLRGGFDLAHVSTPKGERLWLDSAAAPNKVVRAELGVPPLAADERLFMASCDVNGKLDPNVVAIVVTEAGVTRFSKVRQAWRVNIPAARFDLIPVAGITCEET